MGCLHQNIFTRKVTDIALTSDFFKNHCCPRVPCVPVFEVLASPSHTSPRPILDVLKSLVSRPQVPSPHTRVPTSPSYFYTQPRSANFLNVSPFLVGATNIFSELIYPLLKLPNCVLKQQPHISLFSREINQRVYRIHKEGGVVNRFLTARRHFRIPWDPFLESSDNKTLRSVHFGGVVVELIKCKCGGIVRNEIW